METTKRQKPIPPNSQCVTWTGYLITFLMIGFIWWVAWVPAKFFLNGEDVVLEATMGVGAMLGAHAFTFCLVIALFLKKTATRSKCRWLGVLVIPVTFITIFLIALNAHIAWEWVEDFLGYSIQFIALFVLWVISCLIQKLRHHGV